MEPGSLSVRRSLPIDGALLGDVCLRLRRDASSGVLRWTLGERGSVEIDANFTTEGPLWRTQGRVWNPSGLALAGVTLTLAAATPDDVELTVAPHATLPAWWQDRPEGLMTLINAVLDELAEELLWHAARAGIAH
jgi:hypothetical protein